MSACLHRQTDNNNNDVDDDKYGTLHNIFLSKFDMDIAYVICFMTPLYLILPFQFKKSGIMSLEFETVRALQKQCLETPIRTPDYDAYAPLKEAKRLMNLSSSKDAINKLNEVIAKNGKMDQEVAKNIVGGSSTLWSGINKNTDVSTGPLARPFSPVRLLRTACFTRALHCAYSFSLARSFTHFRARGKV